jgi:hypothetical protein
MATHTQQQLGIWPRLIGGTNNYTLAETAETSRFITQHTNSTTESVWAKAMRAGVGRAPLWLHRI